MEHGVQQHSMLARTGSISFNCTNSKIWMSLDVLDQCAAIQPDLSIPVGSRDGEIPFR
jgi:hypothetical protein